ncbi:hypothetical protein BDQ12DRAFT_688444 [Crucibulum laeve]|uniref:Uncharacterized protein n=1 Tax=Crucibulum laeve TaxID=68775 RepID=A0A5C3LQU4_9AGAR|nr:hypothetical protein BDQ12DRAFT_688444 [Crucibulum laeve]
MLLSIKDILCIWTRTKPSLISWVLISARTTECGKCSVDCYIRVASTILFQITDWCSGRSHEPILPANAHHNRGEKKW